MPNSQTPVAFEPFFGGFVLETLTIGMYGEARNAIREYIQNGFDSVQRAMELEILRPGGGLIEIELAADLNSLMIRDNGAGLPVKSAATVLTRVGASGKSHRKNAGFRGIGRLAGIVFSDTVTFTTKAKGEREQTTVIFKAKAMRAAMAPRKGSRKSAVDLMKESVVAFRSASRDYNKHFFKVKLEGFTNAPKECRSASAMYDFVSQVAPVPYPDDFPYIDELEKAAKVPGILIEEVPITIKRARRNRGRLRRGMVQGTSSSPGWSPLTIAPFITHRTIFGGPGLARSQSPAPYVDSRVRGLRVRVRNIQIDGTAIIGNIFRSHAKSYERFQDYFLGEIFIEPSAIVPNARRDGFEEDAAWKRITEELATVVKALGREAHQVSNQGQRSVETLRKKCRQPRGN